MERLPSDPVYLSVVIKGQTDTYSGCTSVIVGKGKHACFVARFRKRDLRVILNLEECELKRALK